ncbi:MAG TPA: DUF4136 domain-containing protein [Caldimonas sp.]|jgi:hypothetical protein|nr:DUF4136 domain-containing protein [Caldimonas sp.]HEX2542114.1 DUF4136 domain-containing protein [Caldimonas sp.]
MITKSLACLGLVAALTGCAALNRVDSDVSSFSRWPAGRAPSTYAFERLPSQQAQPQQAQVLEDAARPAIERAGFVLAADARNADVSVQIGARITVTDRSPFDDPFWHGGFGPWHRPFGYSRFGRGYWSPYWRGGYWGGGSYLPSYEREVAVLIRDKRTGEPLYEARAESEGATAGAATVLPAMFQAAMQDFPRGSATNPHRVSVDLAPKR